MLDYYQVVYENIDFSKVAVIILKPVRASNRM